jgi:hypothetical protein
MTTTTTAAKDKQQHAKIVRKILIKNSLPLALTIATSLLTHSHISVYALRPA